MNARLMMIVLLMASALVFGAAKEGAGVKADEKGITKVKDQADWKRISGKAGKQVLVVDLYADWCGPCRLLAPTMEELSREYRGKAGFYKINTDDNQQLASDFQVTGIPHIAFVRDGKVVETLIGLREKKDYVAVLAKLGVKK